METWKIGLIIGLVWGVVTDCVLVSFSPSTVIWAVVGYIGGQILVVLSVFTIRLIQFPFNGNLRLDRYLWILVPIWGGLLLAGVGYLLERLSSITKLENRND